MMNEKSEDVRITIGSALKQWIENSQYSKADIARMLEVSPQYVNGLCSGKPIGKGMAKKIANQFGLSEYYLLTGEGSLEPTTPNDKSQNQTFSEKIKDSEIEHLKKKIEILEDTIKRQKSMIDQYESFVDLLMRQNKNAENNLREGYVSEGGIQASVYDSKK